MGSWYCDKSIRRQATDKNRSGRGDKLKGDVIVDLLRGQWLVRCHCCRVRERKEWVNSLALSCLRVFHYSVFLGCSSHQHITTFCWVSHRVPISPSSHLSQVIQYVCTCSYLFLFTTILYEEEGHICLIHGDIPNICPRVFHITVAKKIPG